SRCYVEYTIIATRLLSLFKTWPVAEKGPDRYHARLAALAHLKKKRVLFQLLYKTAIQQVTQ
ncbi:hypothetical protein, partial [Bacillus sp. 491mf]|uniref:hypothetical protein n=1 Tax=Bacillus sp. 491mf TaxID=1761755 RepID=UPI001C42E515